MANLVGKKFGKYEITEKLGKGGMAEVYKANHPKLERFVTIKILHAHLAEGEDFLARFEREAKAVASLRHPHIVQIHDYDINEDQVFMVMEYIDGGTLHERLLKLSKAVSYMPVREVVTILRQVAEALDFAHKRGILHRDIKPSNILLDSNGDAFLADFGISRMMSGTQFTATGSLIGTPTYMSPEQGLGEELTDASDIYSLGIILYECITGKVPFSSETTPLAVIHKHISEPPPNPASLRPDLPAAVEQVILKVLAKKPKDRYQNAGDLVKALEKSLPLNVMTKLDGSKGKGIAPLSSLPTMMTEVEPAIKLPNMETAAMGEQTRQEMLGKPSSSVGKPPPSRKKQTASAAKETPAKRPEKPLGRSPFLKFIKSRTAIFILIGLVLAGVLVVVLSTLSPRVSCSTVDACITTANPLRDQGDLVGYLTYISAALDIVPPDQHPVYSGVWCDRGDAERQLGQMDQARASYTTCSDWTQGDPALQNVRDRASQSLSNLP